VETVPVNPPTARSPGDDARQREDWQLSPLVPAIGVGLLALLWLLAAFDGWAATAFCSDRGLGDACRAHVVAAVRPSITPAAIATALAAAAMLVSFATPPAKAVRARLFALSAACWVVALAVVFAAGQAAAA
jgi:hypothetical protein